MTREGRPSNLAASIRDRLLNKARTERLDFNLLLTRYALERLIYERGIPGPDATAPPSARRQAAKCGVSCGLEGEIRHRPGLRAQE